MHRKTRQRGHEGHGSEEPDAFMAAINKITRGAKQLLTVVQGTNEEDQPVPGEFDTDGPYTRIPASAFCLRMAHDVWRDVNLPDPRLQEFMPPEECPLHGAGDEQAPMDDDEVIESLLKVAERMQPANFQKLFGGLQDMHAARALAAKETGASW